MWFVLYVGYHMWLLERVSSGLFIFIVIRLYVELFVNVCVYTLVPAILMYADTNHMPKEFLQWAGLYTAVDAD